MSLRSAAMRSLGVGKTSAGGDAVERKKEEEKQQQHEHQRDKSKAGGLVGELQADVRATAESVDAVLKLFMRATELVDEIA